MNAATSEVTAPELRMFTDDGEEWVIAESAREARDIFCAMSGAAPDEGNLNSADGGAHVEHWTPLPADQIVGRQDECPERHKEGVCAGSVEGCDGKGTIRRKRTCAEWVVSEGKGHFASTNW
jgi:hypothetical protein